MLREIVHRPHPQREAVEQAFLELAQNGYVAIAPDPPTRRLR